MLHPETEGVWGWVSLATCAGVMIAMVKADLADGWEGSRIPNKLTYPAILVGLVLHVVAVSPWTKGLGEGLGGFGLGFGILFIGFLFGGIGGGDVKAAGALGALTGISTTAYGLLYAGLLGGALALATMIWKGKLWSGLRRVWRFFFTALVPGLKPEMPKEEEQDTFPLGVAIAGGFAWAMIEQGLLDAVPLFDLSNLGV
jgi:prepilin peptidase CpaA